MLINTKAITDLFATYGYIWQDGVLTKYNRFSKREQLGVKPEQIDAALNFKTKDEYLQWVKDWKKIYSELSNEIRCYKRARSFDYTRNGVSEHSTGPYKGYVGDVAALEAKRLGWQATALLEARRQAKIRSWELRTARLAAEVAK